MTDPGALLAQDDWIDHWFRERSGPRLKQHIPAVEVGAWHRIVRLNPDWQRLVRACRNSPAPWPSGGMRWEIAFLHHAVDVRGMLPGAICPRCVLLPVSSELEIVASAGDPDDALDALVDRILDRMRDRAIEKLS